MGAAATVTMATTPKMIDSALGTWVLGTSRSASEADRAQNPPTEAEENSPEQENGQVRASATIRFEVTCQTESTNNSVRRLGGAR